MARRATPAHRSALATAWQIPALAAGLTALVLVVATLFPKGAPPRSREEVLREIEESLNRGHYAPAMTLADALLASHEAPDSGRALAYFYRGRAQREEALQRDLPPAEMMEQAQRDFDSACALPLPAEPRESALLWAGEWLERRGRNGEAAARYSKGAALGGSRAGALRLSLVRAWSKADHPDLANIGLVLDRALEDAGVSDDEKVAALVATGDAAIRAEREDEAERRFVQALRQYPQAEAVGRAHLRLACLFHRAGRYPEALGEAKAYLTGVGQEDGHAVTAAYVLADSLLETGKLGDALTAFRQVRLDFPGKPEGRAAALREVVCRIRQDRGTEALSLLKPLLADARPKDWAGNPWLGPADVKEVVAELNRLLFRRDEYPRAVELAHAARDLVPEAQYLETLATAHRLEAEQEERLAAVRGPEAAEHRERARCALISAGDALVSLAEATMAERVFTDHLWSAVECYRKAQAYRRAADALETFIRSKYVASAPGGERHAQAQYYLGECYAAIGRPEEAIELFKSIARTYPRNPHGYLARLARAECCLTQDRLEEAEAGLTAIVDNTEGDLFNPRSQIWRKAIFLLGDTLHRRRKHREAIVRLEEAVARYPDKPETQRGRYVLAECHRARAIALDGAETRPTAALRRQRRTHFTAAMAQYRKLVEGYDALEAGGAVLDSLDDVQRRNSAFFLGDCQFELEQYDEAIAAYERAAFRYRGDPRSLSAYVRISDALRRQSKLTRARAAAERARLMLREVPGDDLEKRPAGISKQRWMAWLDWADRLE